MINRIGLLLFMLISTIAMKAQPKPSIHQLRWHEMEFYLFAHFGPNTFTDKEWGHGDEPENIFNPTSLDCRQWCRIAKAAGAKGIIITAKHHDGFCLWPSKYSKHTVRESKWKNGKGDVLKELSQACKEYGLKFGVYISPWDRNHPDYGTEKYNDVFVNMMKEIFSSYGPIWELWWDGANGEGPNGKKQVYDWGRFEKTVRKLSPSTVIFSDIGPDIRWVGNEKGIAGETNWYYLDTAGFKRGIGAPPNDTLSQGNVNGARWVPAECDVSIRPGWFYHANEDVKVKTPGELFDLYLKSVGRGANLLLNVPPDRRGMIAAPDSVSLVEFGKLISTKFSKDLAGINRAHSIRTNGGFLPGSSALDLTSPGWINCIVLGEQLQDGQTCAKFRLRLLDQQRKLLQEFHGTTIGHKRILMFKNMQVSFIELYVDEQKFDTRLREFSAYLIEGLPK